MLESFVRINSELPYFFTGVFFVLGAIVGSFLNVCILRIPRGESIVSPGSHCACGKPIALWNNIPIFSWFILRGRAACCGRKFSVRYSLIEALTGFCFAGAWYLFPWQAALAVMIFCAFAIVLAFIDWDTMFLPDSVNASFVLAGLFCSYLLPGIHEPFSWPFKDVLAYKGMMGFLVGLIGLGVGSALAYWFRYFASLIMRREAMGEGDVILLGGIGAFCGLQGAVFAFFASSFLGLFAIALEKLFSKKRSREQCLREASYLSLEGSEAPEEVLPGSSRPRPMGPWLLLAAAIYLCAREQILSFIIPGAGSSICF